MQNSIQGSAFFIAVKSLSYTFARDFSLYADTFHRDFLPHHDTFSYNFYKAIDSFNVKLRLNYVNTINNIAFLNAHGCNISSHKIIFQKYAGYFGNNTQVFPNLYTCISKKTQLQKQEDIRTSGQERNDNSNEKQCFLRQHITNSLKDCEI